MNLLEILKILSDDTRYKIIELLSAQDLCVGALAKRLGITNAAVSQHLQILRKGGLVTGEKRGYWTHYTVEKAVLELAAEQLKSMSILATARRSECHKLTVRPTATDNTRRKKSMCKCNCEQPDKLKESLENCSKEQIKECHADQENHPCEKPKK